MNKKFFIFACIIFIKLILATTPPIENFSRYEKDVNHYIEGLNIHWFPVEYRKKPPIVSTIFDLVKMYFKSKKLIKMHSYSLVHCRSH